MANGYEEKAADMWRLYHTCAYCKEKKFFCKRVIVKVPNAGNAISPNFFCKQCRVTITSKLEPKI